MITPPTAPSPGKPVSAGFFSRLIAWVRSGQLIEGPNYRLHRTTNGTSIELGQAMKPGGTSKDHPWKVFAFAKDENRDAIFEIIVPDEAVHVGDSALDVEGITPVEDKEGRYTIDCESEIEDNATIYLAILKEEGEEEEEDAWKAKIVSTLESIEDAKEVLAVLPIAEISIDSSGDNPVGKVEFQFAHSSLAFEKTDDDRGSSAVPSPFQYDVTETEDPDTHEKTKIGSISNCKFYWDGELQELSDYSPSGTCTVYLVCTQGAPSSSGEQEWEFEISEEEGEATSGGRVVNYKLYDIEDHEVTMDYRTTFLDLSSPHKVARFVVEKPSDDDHPTVTLDATSDAVVSADYDSTHKAEMKADSDGGKLALAAGEKSATLDPTDLQFGDAAGIHKLTVTHSDGTTTEYDVFSNEDISITEGGGGGELPDLDVLKDVELAYDTDTHYFTAKKTTVNLKTLDETVGNPETIFQAAPHYQNENPPNLTGVTFDQ